MATRPKRPGRTGADGKAAGRPKGTSRARAAGKTAAAGRTRAARRAGAGRILDWQMLSTQEHARFAFKAALLPLGTIEAHANGPIGTDNLIPAALCRRLSPRLGIPSLPLMPYGLTCSLLAYPGSCTLSAETLASFLLDVGRSLHSNGLEHLIVINGHGGNTATLHEAAHRLFRETRLHVAVFDWWWEVQTQAVEIFGPGGMGHASIDEMGTLLGLYPELSERVPRGLTPSFYVYKGLKTYPAVRPAMTYEHPDDPVDFTRLTPEQCARFADVVTDVAERVVREILEGWNAIGR